MQCLAFICGGQPAPKPLVFAQEEQAAVDAACKLMTNFEKVVQDICNTGPLALGGGQITQDGLTRVDPKYISHVRAMVKATCCGLLGKEMPGVSTSEEALVWNQAARFLGLRIQGSAEECPGRAPDMSPAVAAAMKKVLAKIEVGYKLMSNRERIVNDITNPAPKSQQELKRVDSKHKQVVDAMVSEVTNRCFGKATCEPPAGEQAMVWAAAANFFAARIQEPSDWKECQSRGFPNRKSDMTPTAAAALRTVLGQMEASILLKCNHENVVQDIVNAGPQALRGGQMTQLELKRVDPKHKASVDNMVKLVAARLSGTAVSAPSTAEEAAVWMQAAQYLSKRIQSSPAECEGRKADMSPNAAKEMRSVLAQIEAGCKLTSNRETVLKDITNPGPLAVKGGQLTQLHLKRVDSKHQAAVDAMLCEMCSRLFGQKKSEPSTAAEASVWAQAAVFLNGRIQGMAYECPGREADMSAAAAQAMRVVMAQMPNQTKTISAPATALCQAVGQI